jgi:hypothetical protein
MDSMKLPWGDRPWLPVLWLAEACIAVGAVVTLARGGAPRDMLVAVAYLILCAAALSLPGPLLRRALTGLGLGAERRRLVLQLYLAVAAGAVAATLGTQRGWAAVVAILLTGNAILTLELEARAEGSAAAG